MQVMPIEALPPSQIDRDEKGAEKRAASIGAGAGAVDNVIASSQGRPFDILLEKAKTKTDPVARKLLRKLLRNGGRGSVKRTIDEAEKL